MNSRERVIAAINHIQPDKTPIDFGAMRSTGISITAYDALKKHLGMLTDKPSKLYDVFQQLAEPDFEILARMGGDVVQAHRLSPSFGYSIKNWKEAVLPGGVKALVPSEYAPVKKEDGSLEISSEGRVIARMPSGGFFFDSVYFPLAHVSTIEDLASVEFNTITDEELDFMEAQVKALYENTDKAILMAFGGNILEGGEGDFGFEYFMELLLTEPELVHAWARKKTDAYLNDLKKLLPRVAKYINVINFGDDLGTQESLLISVDTYREMIMPYHKEMFMYVQKNFPEVKVFLHSCGAIEPLIPSLIEAGVQILNPVQISARGMDPAALKEKYGGKLVFWGGGANMQHTVTYGGVKEIAEETEMLVKTFSPGGGYVFTQVHNIQANVPPEKILAIYDTALKVR